MYFWNSSFNFLRPCLTADKWNHRKQNCNKRGTTVLLVYKLETLETGRDAHAQLVRTRRRWPSAGQERGLERNQSCPHLDLGLSASNSEEINFYFFCQKKKKKLLPWWTTDKWQAYFSKHEERSEEINACALWAQLSNEGLIALSFGGGKLMKRSEENLHPPVQLEWKHWPLFAILMAPAGEGLMNINQTGPRHWMRVP